MRAGDELVQIVRDRADVFSDAPLVVVEDADEPFGGLRDVVQGLEGDPVGQRGVAENRHHVFIRPLLVARRRHAERRGKGSASVPGAVAVMRAFRAQS